MDFQKKSLKFLGHSLKLTFFCRTPSLSVPVSGDHYRMMEDWSWDELLWIASYPNPMLDFDPWRGVESREESPRSRERGPVVFGKLKMAGNALNTLRSWKWLSFRCFYRKWSGWEWWRPSWHLHDLKPQPLVIMFVSHRHTLVHSKNNKRVPPSVFWKTHLPKYLWRYHRDSSWEFLDWEEVKKSCSMEISSHLHHIYTLSTIFSLAKETISASNLTPGFQARNFPPLIKCIPIEPLHDLYFWEGPPFGF